MNDSNIVFLRDITAGTFIMVLSLFVIYGAWALSGYISVWYFLGTLIAAKIGAFIFQVGYYMVRGLYVDIS